MGNCASDDHNKFLKKYLAENDNNKVIEAYVRSRIFDHHHNHQSVSAKQHNVSFISSPFIMQHNCRCTNRCCCNYCCCCYCCLCEINNCYNTCVLCNRNELISKLVKEYQSFNGHVHVHSCDTISTSKKQARKINIDHHDNYFCKTNDTIMNNFVCNQDNNLSLNFFQYKTLKSNNSNSNKIVKTNPDVTLSNYVDSKSNNNNNNKSNYIMTFDKIDNNNNNSSNCNVIRRSNSSSISKRETQMWSQNDKITSRKINDNDNKKTTTKQENKNSHDLIKIIRIDNKMNQDNESKLKLQSIIESVGFMIFPSAFYSNKALKDLLVNYKLCENLDSDFKNEFKHILNLNNQEDSLLYEQPNQIDIDKILSYICQNYPSGKVSTKSCQKLFGYLYFKNLYSDYKKPFDSIANSLQNFYFNLSTLHESLVNHPKFSQRFCSSQRSPCFRCLVEFTNSGDKVLKIFFNSQEINSFKNNFYFGLIEASAFYLFDLEIRVEKIPSLRNFLGYTVRYESNDFGFNQDDDLSDNPDDLCLSVDIFKSTYPFTILVNRELIICQLGDALIKQIGSLLVENPKFLSYFSICKPELKENINFDSLYVNQNMSFVLKVINSQMELKGSITYLNKADCIMFICSPVISSLEQLTGHGMFISDIPIHDATRDIILVGEQTKAQEGLKFRMEKLKKSIVQAQQDTEENKQKNIELLNMIFPSHIAKLLWRGEKVQARTVSNVSLLYSDIVGFTSICSSAQPIEIIEMLKRLYTDFDHVCGLIDVYKIETIGDAYVVAGGLHRPSSYHAQQIAWMALLMMNLATKHHTHKGDEIKIRIGIHSGDVLAGIVGFKQPRYCLFGNNCAIANKFESQSEEKRIHVSPVSKDLIDQVDGFEFESRGNLYLPDNWSTQSDANQSWFLNNYKNKKIQEEEEDILVHVQEALKDYKINQN